MGVTDSRVKKTNEILDGIKVIKLYGWEESFTKVCEFLCECTNSKLGNGVRDLTPVRNHVKGRSKLLTILYYVPI